jgi:di/tricarboxylate transporter
VVYLAAVIVLATLVAMTSGKVPSVLALGTGLAVAGLTGVATSAELFAGLSNAGVITVAAMLVIAKGIVQTGVVSRVTWRLLSSVTTSGQALRRLAVPIGVGSGLMNTTPIVAMLIPASEELEQTRQIPARELLLPIAHITTLAGSITLIGTSSNLLIAGIAGKSDVEVSMLSFAPVALPVAVVGSIVVYFTAPWILRGAMDATAPKRKWRVEIPVSSNANAQGRRAADLGIASTLDFELTAIERFGDQLPPDTVIQPDDLLVFQATKNGVAALWKSPRFGLAPHRLYQVSVRSGEQGSLRDLEDDGHVRVMAAKTKKALRDTPSVPGDTCFVTSASPESLRRASGVGLWQDAASRVPQPRMTWIALGVLVAVIVSASSAVAPVELVSFAGALFMVLTGVLTPTSAARALDWKVLFTLAGSVGLGQVVVSSGLAGEIAAAIDYLSAGSVVLVVIVFVLVTAVMTNLVTNAATASILTPVGLSIATEMNLDPVTLLALIGTSISLTFLNPFSHQSNLMVMDPGGYDIKRFALFGVPVYLVSIVTACVSGYLLLRM